MVLAVALVAFVCGTFFTQPSQGQGGGKGIPETVTGRFNLIPLQGGALALIDTTTGQTWTKAQRGDQWTDEGLPKRN